VAQWAKPLNRPLRLAALTDWKTLASRGSNSGLDESFSAQLDERACEEIKILIEAQRVCLYPL